MKSSREWFCAETHWRSVVEEVMFVRRWQLRKRGIELPVEREFIEFAVKEVVARVRAAADAQITFESAEKAVKMVGLDFLESEIGLLESLAGK